MGKGGSFDKRRVAEVGFFELDLILSQPMWRGERSILVEFSRVISKWVTWGASLGGGREH